MKRYAIWGVGLILGLSQAGFGQAVQPPGPGGPSDLNNLAHLMAQRVRHLGEDIQSDLADAPAARQSAQDATELAQAIDEFHDGLHEMPDPARARRDFAGIDGTWHHLRAQLSQPGASSPAVDRAARRVDEIDVQLHQALGMNPYPAAYAGAGPAPTGIADTQRLAHALVSRSEALAAAIQADMAGDPNGAPLAQDAANLTRAADAFHDSIDANQPIDVAARAFGPVDEIANRIERVVTTNQAPPRVQAAWQAFASVEVLIHQNLGLQAAQPNLQVGLAPPAGGGPSPMVGLADQLAQQTGAFVEAFGPTAGNVPDGPLLLADAERLQAAAENFRQDVARGLAPNQLASEFRDVDATWQRLARRVNRLARGRTGPNIQQVQRIGGTCEQIHRVLGMPGYSPTIGAPPMGGALPPGGGPPLIGNPDDRGAAVLPPAAVPGGRWTDPKEVDQAAQEFGQAAKQLQGSIRDVVDDSPLVVEMGRLAESADHLRDAVAKGDTYEHAMGEFRAIERGYAHFEAALRKDHDVHHDEQVVANAKRVRAAFDHLREHLAGRHDS